MARKEAVIMDRLCAFVVWLLHSVVVVVVGPGRIDREHTV